MCTLIVAAFEVPLAGATVSAEDVPVPGGIEALAQSLMIAPVPDRGRFMIEATRLLYDTPDFRNPTVAAFLQAARQRGRSSSNKTAAASATTGARGSGPSSADPDATDLVPIPLSAQIWSDAVFHRRVPRDEIVLAILADRQASLLCHGLASLDDETLEFLGSHPSVLTRLYERHAPFFAAFASGLEVHDNRVAPVGGADAVPLWEAAVGEKVTRADRFVLALFEANDGRLAFLHHTIASFDPPRRAFAMGSWIPNATARQDRFKLLTGAGLGEIREWHARVLPFGRSSFDFGMAIARLAVAADGTPAPPASKTLWSRAFGIGDDGDESAIDAAWLMQHVLGIDVRQRGDRVDQITFAQRLFGSETDRAELAFVLRSMPRYRALVLTLERMGITRLPTYAAAIRQAARFAGLDGRRGYVAQAQFQGSLALLARIAAVRTFEPPRVAALLDRLLAVPVSDTASYGGGIARWLREDVHPLLPASRDIEGALVAGLGGAPPTSLSRVTWEGQQYRLDIAASERQRLQRVREKQQAMPIDVPLQIAQAAALMAGGKSTLDDLRDIVTEFTALAEDLPPRSRDEEADNLPVGVGLPANTHEVLRKAIDELNRAVRSKDAKRASRAAQPVVELADDLLARSLLSFAYAIHIGDPDGTVLLADDVSHRHDFGFGLKDSEMRARVTWAVPRTEVTPGVPWHVTGSLLGLDVGLSTLSLRRVATDHVLEAPKLTSNARDMFAASVSLLDPLALRDADRDAIAAAIERGEQRVAALADGAQLERIISELGVTGARRRALRWTYAHEPSRVASMLSLTDLLMAGGGRPDDFQTWGMAIPALNGCFCSRLLPTSVWPVMAGRPQLGLTAAMVPDINFRVAIVLKELDLPAALARVVLSGAVQDFIDEARPTDDGDWLSLSRTARDIPRERVEDYVAAATATGPLMPDNTRSPRQAR